jgi:hypothetical protein
MPLRIAVTTTSPGQGSTTYALGLAWSAAGERQVRLIDADPAIGTVRTLLNLDTPASIEYILGSHGVVTGGLETQSVAIGRRPGLRVVPGFRRWEFRPGQVISRVGPAIADLRDDVVIVDIGCPFGPADGDTRHPLAMLSEHFDAVLVVVRAQADLIARAITLLDGAPLRRGRLVIARPPHRREMAATLALLRAQLPTYPATIEWDWDHTRILARDLDEIPLHHNGMLEATGLIGEGAIVHAAGRARMPRLWSRRSAP